jgi:Arc/MetJ-type ribon-helix-helix transcriptional regulator
MNLEIHKPELVQRVNAHIRTGQFRGADEVLEKALDALEERVTTPSSGHEAKGSGDRRTGADLISALQASPHRELDIEPARSRLSMPVRDFTF